MSAIAGLLRRLLSVEALWRGAKTPGERCAAAQARERLLSRLAALDCVPDGRPTEHRFKMADEWDRQIFLALLERHGLRPHRYPRQRRTTMRVWVATDFVEQTLWPEFIRRRSRLRARFLAIVSEEVARS